MSPDPSSLNHLKRRVQVFQFDASVLCCKSPIRFDMIFVAPLQPSPDVSPEGFGIRDTPGQELPGQDGQFRFRRFGHPRLHVVLRREGFGANHKKTHRIYCGGGPTSAQT